MKDNLLWPSPGDRLFDSRGEYPTTAHINRWKADWMVYAHGYATVADLALANSSRIERDSIVYPVIFLYRHAIELALKYTLLIARRLLDEPGGLQKGHGLNNIWAQLRPLLERIWDDGPEHDLRAVDALIREMDHKDQNAEKFRYPISRGGERFFGSDELINLEKFCESGRKVLNFLHGCSTGIGEYLHTKQEMQDAYYGP